MQSHDFVNRNALEQLLNIQWYGFQMCVYLGNAVVGNNQKNLSLAICDVDGETAGTQGVFSRSYMPH